MLTIKTMATAALLSAFAIGSAFTGKVGTTTFEVNAEKSKMHWFATKITGKHEGDMKLTSGSVTTNGQVVTGGSFDIDMTSITVTDISDAEMNGKLVGHLKSDDFFSTEKHHTAHFKITKVVAKGKAFEVSGKMTIKGITQDISFPASITTTKQGVNAKAKIILDRTRWDIKFGSGKFIEDIGDKAISDEFTIDLDLVAGA